MHRDGPRGFVFIGMDHDTSAEPVDRKPRNITGAGNAYSAALTVCRGMGMDGIYTTCLASTIEDAFFDCSHIPPWKSMVESRLQTSTNHLKTSLVSTQI